MSDARAPFESNPPSPGCPLCRVAPVRVVQKAEPIALVECSGCGFLFSHPPPDPEANRAFHDEAYFRRYYGESIEEFHRNRGPLWHRIAEFNRARLAILLRHWMSPGRLLDVGAGQGLFLEVARESGFQVAGCDVSTPTARFHAGRGIEFRTGAVEEAFREPRAFDIVTLWQTLEHTVDPVATLRHVRTLLRAGGIVIVSVPNMGGLLSRIKLVVGKPFLSPASAERHYGHWRPATLAVHLAATGFRVLERTAEPSQERRALLGAIERFGDAVFRTTGFEVQGSLTWVAAAE